MGLDNEVPPTWSESDRTVILVSLDGFRHDYRARTATPALDRIVAEGVAAEGLIPVFPSKTFPNHVSQVTGLYPPEHGIVGNSFYDPDFGEVFDFDKTAAKWWLGEPIWITAAKQGRKAVTVFWPGSATVYDGLRPYHWLPYDGSMSKGDRVDQLLSWLDEDPRPHFGTLYFSDVDSAGHSAGPESSAVDAAVRAVDDALLRLLAGLEDRDLLDEVDLLVVSDHGMAELSRERAVFLDDYTAVDDLYVSAWGPYALIDPRGRPTADLLAELADVPHLRCSDEAGRPPELHFTGSSRIPPILCLTDVGWGVTTHDWFQNHPDDLTGGTHGFDPAATEMHGIFYARGPHFRQGGSHPAFEAVHLYALMAHLLEIEPAENSGSLDVTRGMLRE